MAGQPEPRRFLSRAAPPGSRRADPAIRLPIEVLLVDVPPVRAGPHGLSSGWHLAFRTGPLDVYGITVHTEIVTE